MFKFKKIDFLLLQFCNINKVWRGKKTSIKCWSKEKVWKDWIIFLYSDRFLDRSESRVGN
ncbi:TPA: hypothetical protein I7706_13335 [Vibrio vulnificus]|nr:hypothetical protein [Vibrio vulnificus]